MFFAKNRESIILSIVFNFFNFFNSFNSLIMKNHIIIISLLAVLLTGCSTSKFIPDNQYLLEKVVIKSDNRHLDVTLMEPYIRQKANSKWFSETPPSGSIAPCRR